MAVRIWLKIGRYDSQVSKSNLAMSHLSTLHCSSGAIKRSLKMALRGLVIATLIGHHYAGQNLITGLIMLKLSIWSPSNQVSIINNIGAW